MDTVMWFEKPAEHWLRALPLGNGHIGCMIYNDPICDTLSLNDDTLWSGYEHNYCKKDFLKHMTKVRELMIGGKRAEAEQIVETHLTNRFTQAYMPLGNIIIKSETGNVEKYRRELNMSEGIIYARYIKSGNSFLTETFVSYPDDVLIHIIESQKPADYKISFESRIMHDVIYAKSGFTVTGRAPSDISITDVSNFYSEENKVINDEIEKSIRFAARAEIASDGSITACTDKLSITDAKKIIIVYSSATNLNNNEYLEHCIKTALRAGEKDISTIRKAHIGDHSSLFDRVSIDLGGDDISCDDRYARMKRGEIAGSDISLLFQYGRYLLIGASRNGTQAANLQGIWNKDLIPPWWSGYTLNINLQMNYWLADRANLSSCFDPLSDFAKRLCEAGKRTAREDYGTEGSVAHHQSDIWAHSTPVGYDMQRIIPANARWVMWNMALPWLCIQLFDHYLYNRDDDFLKTELLPIMKNAADFMMKNFTEINGGLYNIPSTSPENMYIDEEGKELAVCNISAMDIGITREFFSAYITACERTGDYEEADRCAGFASHIADYSVSKQGELLEWDRDFAETEKGHRHFSMLFGIYPGSRLLSSPFKDAAKKSLYRRLQNGGGQIGWSAVWAIALLARFGESEAAYYTVKKLLSENIHENMFGAHPPDLFQIDANLGFTAAICELVLQEYGGVVKLLPALPKAMENGSIHGLKIHYGHTVSLEWEESKIVYMEIYAATDGEVIIDAGYLASANANYILCPEGIRISLKKGEEYSFYSIKN